MLLSPAEEIGGWSNEPRHHILSFTGEMRDEYFAIIILKLQMLERSHRAWFALSTAMDAPIRNEWARL